MLASARESPSLPSAGVRPRAHPSAGRGPCDVRYGLAARLNEDIFARLLRRYFTGKGEDEYTI